MAGTMVHLLVAEKLLKELQRRNWRYSDAEKSAFEPDYFIAGNICPDGIMARKNYERSMKLHTHFRDGIPDGSFDKPGMVQLFEKRMRQFWKEHKREDRDFLSLYLGYITHMMTDERFILEERPKFFENIAAIHLTQQERETFIRFNRETDLVDFRLIREFPILQEAKKALERVKPYEIRGMITAEELNESRAWILQHFFRKQHQKEQTQYLEYDSMVRFVETVTQEIINRLFDEHYLEE